MKTGKLLVAVGAVALFSAGHASAVKIHEWNFDNGTADDSVGTAHLTLNGAASIAGGELVLTNSGGAPRTENAQATGAALTELQGTLAGLTEMTVVIDYNVTTAQDWSKPFMYGLAGDSYLDFTPNRGGGQQMGLRLLDGNGGGEQGVIFHQQYADGVDVRMVMTLNNATNRVTLDTISTIGDPSTHFTSTRSLAGADVGNIIVDEFYLGSAVGFNDQDFSGTIDSVAIYDNALNKGQIYDQLGLFTADLDGDGDVDDADFGLAFAQFTGPNAAAGVSTQELSTILNSYTGPGGAGSSSVAVPEPASLAIFGLGGLALLRHRRR